MELGKDNKINSLIKLILNVFLAKLHRKSLKGVLNLKNNVSEFGSRNLKDKCKMYLTDTHDDYIYT